MLRRQAARLRQAGDLRPRRPVAILRPDGRLSWFDLSGLSLARRYLLLSFAFVVIGGGVVALALVWVAVEIAIIGYSNEPPLQAIYGILGVAIMLVAIRWLRDVGLPTMHRAGTSGN